MPPRVGDDRDRRVADAHDLLHAGALHRDRGVDALHLAAEHRAILDRRVEHPGHRQIHPVDLLARRLVDRVEAREALAGDLPVLRILERDVGRRRDLGGRRGDLAVADAAAGRLVRDHAVRDGAFGGGHLPVVGRRLHEHHPRRRAALAHVLVRIANAAASARRVVAPHAIAREVLARRRVFGPHLRPVALELLGDELREARQRPLPHLGARDANHDDVVGLHDDPRVDLLCAAPAPRRHRRTERGSRRRGSRRPRRTHREIDAAKVGSS